jgi:hypothetical protein
MSRISRHPRRPDDVDVDRPRDAGEITLHLRRRDAADVT